MKKVITKFWGVGLVIILLSTLFVGSAAPVAAADYNLAANVVVNPANVLFGGPLVFNTTGIVDVAQSGSTIYAITANGTGEGTGLYKSTNGGASWAPVTTGITITTQNFTMIAVAPDDPNIAVMLDTFNNDVYLTTNGGTLWNNLENPDAPSAMTINAVDISPMTLSRTIVAAGNTGFSTWTLGAVVGAWSTAISGVGTIFAVKYSSNYAADAGLLVLASNATAALSVYSTNLLTWNPAGYGYPKAIGTVTTGNITKATITLDPNFYLGDDATQIGFVGINSAAGAGNNEGGVYRIEAVGSTQIFSTANVNNIAWDGTNMMVAPYDNVPGDALTIYRSANALGIPGTIVFLPSSTFKTPGTGTLPLVLFNGGNAYAFSRGQNSAVAKSTDNGKSFNGFALVNSTFTTIEDYWIASDASRIYAVVDDGLDTNVWRYDAGVWQRIFISADNTGSWLVRVDADAPDTVYIGLKGGTTMYKALDAGDITWTTRASSATIADFVVQDANTLYLASNANAFVYKSINGAFTWVPTTLTAVTGTLGGVAYSLTALGDDQLIFASSTGGVAYTLDGATWTAIPVAPAGSTTNIIATATGLTAGSTIWIGAAGNTGGVSSWTIGTNVAAWDKAAATANITGLVLNNGVLYAYDDGNDLLYRFLTPSIFSAALGPTDTEAAVAVATQTTIVNTLKATNGSNVLWIVNEGTLDSFYSYTDHLISAADAPVPVTPVNGAQISVNSLSGAPSSFVFQWNAPAFLAAAPATSYTYTVSVYLDELGTIAVGSVTTVTSAGGVVANLSSTNAGFGPTGLNLMPGTTYYWRVRTTQPVTSYWSPMQSFNVQQLQAIVPTLGSPQNGATIAAGQTVAFSWSPITGTATYKLEVSTVPDFATTIYSTTTTSAGASLPSSVKLTPGATYFWRVKSLTPVEGDWSTVGNFTVAVPVTTPPAVTPTSTVTTIVVEQPDITTTVITIPPAETTTVNPSYIWAIIIIGAVLVIAVIVLIVRTRRSV